MLLTFPFFHVIIFVVCAVSGLNCAVRTTANKRVKILRMILFFIDFKTYAIACAYHVDACGKCAKADAGFSVAVGLCCAQQRAAGGVDFQTFTRCKAAGIHCAVNIAEYWARGRLCVCVFNAHRDIVLEEETLHIGERVAHSRCTGGRNGESAAAVGDYGFW